MVRKRSWPAVSHYDSFSPRSLLFEDVHFLQFVASPSCHPTRSSGFSGQPRQQWSSGAFDNNRTHKVDPDRRNVALGIGVVRKPQEQAGLPHTRVTDEQKLEEVVVSVCHGC